MEYGKSHLIEKARQIFDDLDKLSQSKERAEKWAVAYRDVLVKELSSITKIIDEKQKEEKKENKKL